MKTGTFGSTPNGIDWCIKALHPSDPMTEVRGIPDKSAAPSMFMNFQTVSTISPAASATGTWSTDVQLIPHPIALGAFRKVDSTGTSFSEVLNSQLNGADHVSKFNSFSRAFRRWRLAYASVTIYQDGPDLANQGTVVACQKPLDLTQQTLSYGKSTSFNSVAVATYPMFYMQAEDFPDYTVSQSMPNAYFGRSRDGIYCPLKLTENHQQWHGPHDLIYQGSDSSLDTNPNSPSYLQSTLATSTNAASIGGYPFTTLNALHVYRASPNESYAGSPTSSFCNTNWADISFKNMAVTTSLSLFFRFGFECQVLPGSIYSPQLKLSPPYDPIALSTYYAISRELKDGYPADFNDLGKIWSAIKDAASLISPVVELIPGIGPTIVGAGKMAGKVGDKIVGAIQRAGEPTVGSTASAGDKEVVKKVLDAIPPAPIAPRFENYTAPRYAAPQRKSLNPQLVNKLNSALDRVNRTFAGYRPNAPPRNFKRKRN